MKTFHKVSDLRQELAQLDARGIGFVPTMGALHAGHRSLVEKARKECQTVVVSVFVNPTQFNDKNDLKHYPRTPEADAAVLEAAGADYVGLDEYIEKIKGGWTDVDVIITMPSIMGKIGALGRVLGPRGLMPNPKSGTVTNEVGKAVKEVKQGKIDFKVDKFGIVHTSVGKVSFTADKIYDNAKEFINTLIKLKPSSAKGTYVKSIYLSSTMSLGIKIDPKSVDEN
jgi:ribosomal protein L1